LEKLGKAIKLYKKKLIIAQILNPRKKFNIGDKVLGPDLSFVGKIVDIIGNVESPYAIILPQRVKNPEKLLGRTLYSRSPKKMERRNKKPRRKR